MPSVYDVEPKFRNLLRPITIVNRSRSALNELGARTSP